MRWWVDSALGGEHGDVKHGGNARDEGDGVEELLLFALGPGNPFITSETQSKSKHQKRRRWKEGRQTTSKAVAVVELCPDRQVDTELPDSKMSVFATAPRGH